MNSDMSINQFIYVYEFTYEHIQAKHSRILVKRIPLVKPSLVMNSMDPMAGKPVYPAK